MNPKLLTLSVLAALGLLCACDRSSAEAVGTTLPTILPNDSAGTSATGSSLPDSVRGGFCEVATIANAFAQQTSGLSVSQSGTVTKVLADDLEGDRHQRFVLKLSNAQTVLVAHNIDLAPRLAAIAVGKTVAFKGIYEWNAEGGVVHWTHHDPAGSHTPGWLWMDGQRVQ